MFTIVAFGVNSNLNLLTDTTTTYIPYLDKGCPKMRRYGLLTEEGTCEMETTAQRDSSRLSTKMDSNVAKCCRHNDDGGQGYVILVVFYLCTDLIFFTNTVQRVLLLIRSICVGKLFTVFILLLGRSEVILTSRLLSQLLNLLSIIERPRTIFNTSSNFLLHCWTAGMEWMEK